MKEFLIVYHARSGNTRRTAPAYRAVHAHAAA
jgi:hypothetical protein